MINPLNMSSLDAIVPKHSNNLGGKFTIGVKIILIVLLSLLVIVIIANIGQKATAETNQASQLIDQDREQYKEQLSKYFDNKFSMRGLQLVQSNFQFSPASLPNMEQLEAQEYDRLNDHYHFDQFKLELPFCIIVQRLNILDGFSFEFTLNSIFNQNYSNYKAIIIHQPFTKGFTMVAAYLQKHKINQNNYIHIVSSTPKSILRALYDNIHEHCSHDSIVIPLQQSGELIGKNVLKVYNVLYQVNKVGLIFSDYYRHSRDHYVKLGSNFNALEHQFKSIRREVIFIRNSITFRTNFFLSIPRQELLGTGYIYYDIVYEHALIFPLVEMMCGIVMKIDGFYLLTKENFQAYNHFIEYLEMQKSLSDQFRNKPKFKCNETYQFESKSSFFIRSLSRKHLKDKELRLISRENRQMKASIQRSTKNSLFHGNPKKEQSRKADAIIYGSHLQIVESKRQYQLTRFDFCQTFPIKQDYRLAKYNLFLGSEIDEMQSRLQEKYVDRIQQQHSLSLYGKYEIPLCIVIAELPSRVAQFRFEPLLNSIFSQDYSNFVVVINNRNPELDELVRKYLDYYKIEKGKYAYIERHYSSSPLQAVYNSLTQVCHRDSIAVILSGKQEFLGRQVFKIINSKFREDKYSLIYAKGYHFNQEARHVQAFASTNYSHEEKKESLYRSSSKKYSHLVAFKAKMFLRINLTHLHDEHGSFFTSNWDEAIYFPLLEMSCSLNTQIEGEHYIRHHDLTENDAYQQQVGLRIRNISKYSCFQDEKQGMEEVPIEFYRSLASLRSFRVQKNEPLNGQPAIRLDLLQKNRVGQRIAENLYRNMKEVILQREQYHDRRQRVFQKWQGNIALELSMFNLKKSSSFNEIEAELVNQDFKSFSALQNTNQRQVPICVVIDLLFTTPFQFEYTLNSLFLQNYSNYFAVILGDGSNLGEELIQKYLDFNRIPLERFVYLPNSNKIHGLQNLATSVHQICSQDSFVIYFHEFEEFVGRTVLKLVSDTIQEKGSWMIYGSSFMYNYEYLKEVKPLVEQIDGSMRRKETAFRLPFVVFSSQLFRKLDLADLQDENGHFYKESFEKVLFLPMIQMACNRIAELDGSHLLRTRTDSTLNQSIIIQLNKLNEKRPYKCLQGA